MPNVPTTNYAMFTYDGNMEAHRLVAAIAAMPLNSTEQEIVERLAAGFIDVSKLGHGEIGDTMSRDIVFTEVERVTQRAISHEMVSYVLESVSVYAKENSYRY